jgi:TRAP-type C4-dicarboxylate transport system permease large subunit
MDCLEFLALVVPGFVAYAEFALLLFMRRSIRMLPEPDRIKVEQRFIRTFNRVMPIVTGLSVFIVLLYALRFKEESAANRAVWGALFFFCAATASYIWLNRSLDQEIIGWDPEKLPVNWKSVRTRCAIAQGLRASLQLAGFLLLCGSIASR